MKWASLFSFIVVIVLALSQESKIDENGCVWFYKGCCEFKEINGIVTCSQMCEPEIKCDTTEAPEDQNKSEVAEEPIFQKPAAFAFSMNVNHICRKGFRLDSKGNCKRIFGQTIERTTESVR